MKNYNIQLSLKRASIIVIMMVFILLSSALFTGCKKDADPPQKDPPPQWELDATGKYPYTMTAVVTLSSKMNTQIKSDDQLGAFIDGTCRGIGTLHDVEGKPVFFVLIHGDVAEQQPVQFEYYSSHSSALYYSSNALQFAVDGNFGLVDDPKVLLLQKK